MKALFGNFPANSILIVLLFLSLSINTEDQKLTIGVSKTSSDHSYTQWLNQFSNNIDFINMYSLGADSIALLLELCDGILITGGNDVFPGRYNEPGQASRCGTFDLRRDTLEYMLVQYALKNNIPILGICRGEQIMNVINGGSLYIDIPTDVGEQIAHRNGDEHSIHLVNIDQGSMLYKICGVSSGEVYSHHHQAVKLPGKGIIPVASSADGIIEAIELESEEPTFFLGVQWHPEKMDKNSRLSKPIGAYFIQKAEEYAKAK